MSTTFHGMRHALLPALSALVSCLLLPVPAATGPLDAHRVERTVWLMGTEATVRVDAPTRAEAIAASESAVDAMATVESLLSTWRDDSQLSRVNRSAVGTRMQPSARVAGWLREMAGFTSATGGAVDPAVGALVDAWDLRGEGRVPDAAHRHAARAASGASGILVDATTGAVTRLHGAAWLDAGAFGKGAALRAAQAALVEAGATAATLDLGGQILHLGSEALPVSVAHPARRDRPFTRLLLKNASVATTGQSERGFDIDGVRHGHVLDPRSGAPVPAWGSVTVVAEDPLAADALSTALFVMGADAGFAWASAEGIAALFLIESNEAGVVARATPALSTFLEHPLPGMPRAHSSHERGDT